MAAVKLNSVIQTNIPLVVTRKKYGGEYDNKYQPGEKIYLYIFVDEKGVELSHYASPMQHEELSLYKDGEKLQIVRQEKMEGTERRTIYAFTPTEGAEARAAATPQLKGNTTMVREEREQVDFEHMKKVHDWKLGLAGLLQAYIIRGAERDDARRLAIEDAKWIRETAENLA